MYKKFLIAYIISIFFFLFISGCDFELSDKKITKESGKKVYRLPGISSASSGVGSVGIVDGVFYLDPKSPFSTSHVAIAQNIFDGLVEYNPFEDGIMPALAESWEISADGLTYTFHIRKNVYFQHSPIFPDGKGRLLTANDVHYSFLRICEPATANNPESAGWWLFEGIVLGANEYHEGKSQNLKGFEVVDDFTFRVKLTKITPDFLYRLTLPYAYIIPREGIEKLGQGFGNKPVGTGAFRLVKMNVNGIILVKNSHYWQRDKSGNQLPYLDRVEFINFTNPIAMFANFRNGLIDVCNIPKSLEDVTFVKMGNQEELKLNPKLVEKGITLKLFKSTPDIFYMLFNFRKDSVYIKNKKIRQALNYAINREKIIEINRKASLDKYIPAKGLVPSELLDDYDSIPGFEYNPKLALKLLAEAGFPNGRGLPTLYFFGFVGQDQLTETINSVIEDFKAIGIKSEILPPQAPTSQADISGSSGWVADYPSAENFFFLFTPGVQNFNGYNREEFNNLYRRAQNTIDSKKQMEIYKEMEKFLRDDPPCIFTVHLIENPLLMYDKVENIPTNPFAGRHPKYIKIR